MIMTRTPQPQAHLLISAVCALPRSRPTTSDGRARRAPTSTRPRGRCARYARRRAYRSTALLARVSRRAELTRGSQRATTPRTACVVATTPTTRSVRTIFSPEAAPKVRLRGVSFCLALCRCNHASHAFSTSQSFLLRAQIVVERRELLSGTVSL